MGVRHKAVVVATALVVAFAVWNPARAGVLCDGPAKRVPRTEYLATVRKANDVLKEGTGDDMRKAAIEISDRMGETGKRQKRKLAKLGFRLVERSFDREGGAPLAAVE